MALPPPYKLCNLPTQVLPSTRVLSESSGIVDSRLHPQTFWTHNDSGGTWVYAIGYDGTHRKSVRLAGANVSGGDWEDIAYHAASNTMWVADSGNNAHTKDTFRAFRFTEPAILGDPAQTLDVTATTFMFAFSDAPVGGWDCECMMVDPSGRLYFVNKESSSLTKLYRAPEVLEPYPTVNVLSPVANWAVSGICAGDWASDNSAIVIAKNTTAAYEYDPTTFALRRQFTLPEAFKSDTSTTSQEESLAFTRDGNNLLRGSEGTGSQVWWVPFRESATSQGATVRITLTAGAQTATAECSYSVTGGPLSGYSDTLEETYR